MAQPYWVRHIGSLGNDHISDVKVDEAGDIYITGEFSGTADFGDSTYVSMGGLDMFVAKLAADGGIMWWRQGGGYGLDRGIKLAFGPNNTLAVVGEFTGQATFQGTAITSQNFTADMFVALLDRSNGTQQWIRQGGGATGGDRPYGVTISANGQVTLAGEFRGAASWSGFTLNSIPDPNTSIPSSDVVVVSYAADGTALWVQQGAAERDDRAIDVVNDPAGNIYVAGQFSDTITFDTQHPNAMYNSSFLLKLDASGQEQWFRRCGGAVFDHVRDMAYTPDDQLLLVGDLQGTMIFLDNAPDQIASTAPYSYYVMRVSSDGEHIAHTVLGSENGLSARGVDLRNDTVVVLGQFDCRFTSMSDHYGGTGLWCAAGAEDLFVAKHRYDDLGFIEARHFGGSGAKSAGQVATLPNGDVIACGSYSRNISFPMGAVDPVDVDQFTLEQSAEMPSRIGDCQWFHENAFADQDATGLKDGLLCRTYARDSVVFDWFHRSDMDCAHDFLPAMCISDGYTNATCPDTLVFCGEGQLIAQLPFPPALGNMNSVGALVHAEWSTGDTMLTLEVTNSGTYSVSVSAVNGCWSWSDTIVVIVNPMPPQPAISDDVVVNTNDTSPQDIHLCDPDSATIWCSNIDPNTTWFWVTEPVDTLPLDSVFAQSVVVDTSGYWWFTMMTDKGCARVTGLLVIDHATVVIPPLDLDALIGFPQAIPGTDSVMLCEGTPLELAVDGSWSLNGNAIQLPGGLTIRMNVDSTGWGMQYSPDHWYWSGSTFTQGWNTFNVQVLVTNTPCGTDSLLFSFSDQVWVGVWPSIAVSIDMSGPNTMCVGDSVLLTTTCTGCQSYAWSGPGVSNDTLSTAWANHEGYYEVIGIAHDDHGCVSADHAVLQIDYPPGPLLSVVPGDGIICPNDSALIQTGTPGTDQVWYGPNGPVPNNSQQLWSSIPGEYYLAMTDTQGCFLTSDAILLTGYGTPYLNVSPDNVLCLTDDEVLIQVVTTVPSGIVWGAPLSGSALEQTVTEPGTYSVSATACGIITELSVVVIASDVQSQVVDPGPFTICAGDSITLEAVPGQTLYIWQPGDVYATEIVVSEPGEYVLQALDGNGCMASSAPVVVDLYAFPEPLVTTGDTICPGDGAVLSAAGSGTIQWYADSSGQQPLFTGSLFLVNGLMNDTTFFVGQSDAQCASPLFPVSVIVQRLNSSLLFTAPVSACSGGTAVITAFADGATQYDWNTPTGNTQGATITIDPVEVGDAGLYICTASAGSCATATDTLVFGVTATASLDLGQDVIICSGASVSFQLDSSFTAPLWNGVPGGFSYTTLSGGQIVVQAMDSSGCIAVDTVLVIMNGISMPVSANDVTVCAGEDAHFAAFGSGTIQWSLEADMDPVISTGSTYTWPAPSASTTLHVAQTEQGCPGDTITVNLVVDPVPTGVLLDAPIFTCAGDTLMVTLDGPVGVSVQWSTPAGAFSGTSITITDFAPSDAGTYTAVPFLGDCAGDTLAADIAYQAVIPFSLGPDTTYCIGGSITLEAPGTHTAPQWSTGAQSGTIDVSSDGIYGLIAIDQNGCSVEDEVAVTGIECAPIIPNIITPNGDGVHDSWTLDPGSAGFRTAALIVFDRHGGKVFQADPSRTPFAGKNDAGEPLSDGVYYYVLRLVKLDDTYTEQAGYMHLNR